MIKNLLITGLLSILSFQGFAQDVITKKTGEGIKSKVLEITPSEIKYKLYENLEGPIYTLAKADVLVINYENNTQEIITGSDSFTQGAVVTETKADSRSLYDQGKNDARMHYKGYKGAGTGTLVTSLLSPLLGLVPAIACSTVQPKEHNLDYPDHELMKNADYSIGYKNEARKTKNRKVWHNWGIAFGVNLAFAILAVQ